MNGSISAVGIRKGDILRGVSEDGHGNEIRIRKLVDNPKKEFIVGFVNPDINIIEKTIHFVESGMDIDDYIMTNLETSSPESLNDIPNVKIEFVKMSPILQNLFKFEVPKTMNELAEALHHRVSVFSAKNWLVITPEYDPNEGVEKKDIYYNLDKNVFNKSSKRNQTPLDLEDRKFNVFMTEGDPMSSKSLIKLAKSHIDGLEDIPNFDDYETSLLISIIQASIRAKPKFFEFEDGFLYSAVSVAIGAFIECCSRDAFDQVLTSLVQTIINESTVQSPEQILSMLVFAVYHRVGDRIVPTREKLCEWFDIIDFSITCDKVYELTEPSDDIVVDSVFFFVHEFSVILKLPDTKIIENWAKRKALEKMKNYVEEYELPIWHVVDLHLYPNFPLFMKDTFGKKLSTLLSKIDLLTSNNPRRTQMSQENDLLDEIRSAQKNAWIYWKNSDHDKIDEDEDGDIYNAEIPLEIILGMIGNHTYSIGKKKFIISLTLTEEEDETFTYDFHVILAVNGLKDYNVSEEQREDIIEQFLTDLENGLELRVPPSLEWLGYEKIKLDREEMEFYIETSRKTISLNKALSKKISYPILRKFKDYEDLQSVFDIVAEHRHGIAKNHDEIIDHILRSYDKNTLNRLKFYTERITSTLETVRLTGSSDYSPVIEDIHVYQLWCLLAAAYPAFLKQNKDCFEVKNSIFLWDIFDQLTAGDLHRDSVLNVKKDEKILRPHQEFALEYLKERYDANRSAIIWSNTGTGKTLMLARFLYSRRNNLPRYIVYVHPKSAYETVVKEFKNHQITVNDIEFHSHYGKIIMKGRLMEDAINFIEQDYLYKGIDILMKTAKDTMLIIDEVHNHLNGSLRTSAALRFSSSCNHFIGVTGTLVKDSYIQLLFPYLAKLVRFEITPENYVSSFNKMFIAKTNLDIKESWFEEIAPYNSKDEALIDDPDYPADEKNRISIMTASRYEVKLAVYKYREEETPCVIVSDSKLDSEFIAKCLVDEGFTPRDIMFINGSNVVNLEYGAEIPPFCIVERRMNAGYNLTAYHCMIMGVYAMNSGASLVQLFGRIKRIGQKSPVEYYTVIAPHFKEKHEQHKRDIGLSKSFKTSCHVADADDLGMGAE